MSSASAATGGQTAAKGKRKFTVDALFTDHRPQAVGVEDLPTAKEIRLDRIEADPDQPRRTFDPDRLAELAAIGRLRASTQSLVGRPLSVRLMTRHQAKGREMDAVVFVHHPDDFERAGGAATDRRVLYVSLTRARQTVALVLRPQPMESMSGFINLCGSSQRADVRRPN